MSGIILFFLLATWFYIVAKICGWIVSGMRPGNKKAITLIVIFTLLFIAPVGDEIVGGFQFRALCARGTKPVYDAEKAMGKTVILKQIPDRIIKKVIPIREQIWDWVDIKTGEPIIIYKRYYASGGWLSQIIGFPQGSPPYIFNGTCGSKESFLIFGHLNIIKNVDKYYGEE